MMSILLLNKLTVKLSTSMSPTSRGDLLLLRVFVSVRFQAIIKQTLLRYQSNTSVLHILSFEAEENSPKRRKPMAAYF